MIFKASQGFIKIINKYIKYIYYRSTIYTLIILIYLKILKKINTIILHIK